MNLDNIYLSLLTILIRMPQALLRLLEQIASWLAGLRGINLKEFWVISIHIESNIYCAYSCANQAAISIMSSSKPEVNP